MVWRCSNLSISYADKLAVDNLSFELDSGQCLALIGPNGSGKSSAIRCLATLQKPNQGSFSYEGISLFEKPIKLREKLGYVSQEIALDKTLTGMEMMEMHAGLYHLPWRDVQDKARDLLKKLGLTEAQDKRIKTYSGGMQRRLDLAMALLGNPKLLILDEPSAGLDINVRELVWNLLRNYMDNGGAIILASHDFQEIDYLSDMALILRQGATVAHGELTSLKSELGTWVVQIKSQTFMDESHLDAMQDVLQESLPRYQTSRGKDHLMVAMDQSNMDQAQKCVADAFENAGMKLTSIQVNQVGIEEVYRFRTEDDRV